MKTTSYKFSKLTRMSAVILLWISAGAPLSLFGDDPRGPSIDAGGPKIYVENNTDYAIRLDDVSWKDRNGSLEYATNYTFGPQSHGVATWEYCGKEPKAFTGCFWGAPGEKNGGLNIHSVDNKWNNGDNNGTITITIIQGQTSYGDTFSVDKGCTQQSARCCLKIDWTVDWNNDGWKITLTQRLEDNGYPGGCDGAS